MTAFVKRFMKLNLYEVRTSFQPVSKDFSVYGSWPDSA